jgi:isoleucyl-tRNA synthetase
MGRAARSKSSVKVRQPLSAVVIKARSSSERAAINMLCPQILDELNVKSIQFSDEDLQEGKELSVSVEGDYQVGVVTGLTPELINEGLAREIVRRLQTMRKNGGLEIADHILTYYTGNDQIDEVMKKFSDYISQETLSEKIAKGIVDEVSFSEKFKLSGIEVTLAIKKK